MGQKSQAETCNLLRNQVSEPIEVRSIGSSSGHPRSPSCSASEEGGAHRPISGGMMLRQNHSSPQDKCADGIQWFKARAVECSEMPFTGECLTLATTFLGVFLLKARWLPDRAFCVCQLEAPEAMPLSPRLSSLLSVVFFSHLVALVSYRSTRYKP